MKIINTLVQNETKLQTQAADCTGYYSIPFVIFNSDSQDEVGKPQQPFGRDSSASLPKSQPELFNAIKRRKKREAPNVPDRIE